MIVVVWELGELRGYDEAAAELANIVPANDYLANRSDDQATNIALGLIGHRNFPLKVLAPQISSFSSFPLFSSSS